MPKFRKATKTTIERVLRAMADQCKKGAHNAEDYAKVYAEKIDPILQELMEDDFFGTEGQCDPRGDHRD